MIRIQRENGVIVLVADSGDLAPRHESQLAFWGFTCVKNSDRFERADGDLDAVVAKLVAYLERFHLRYALAPEIREILNAHDKAARKLSEAIARGADFKNARGGSPSFDEFIAFARSGIARRLKDHQIKAAVHLLAVENGANFSVPGSGKTSVVLTVFEWLRKQSLIDSLFVVGPPSCFGPWRDEYEAVLGRAVSAIPKVD